MMAMIFNIVSNFVWTTVPAMALHSLRRDAAMLQGHSSYWPRACLLISMRSARFTINIWVRCLHLTVTIISSWPLFRFSWVGCELFSHGKANACASVASMCFAGTHVARADLRFSCYAVPCLCAAGSTRLSTMKAWNACGFQFWTFFSSRSGC